jgi:membrane fusion protein (multidrug efflux system)
MSTVVRVHNQDERPQIVVPSRAVVEQMGEYFLFVAKDTILKEKAQGAAAGSSDAKATGAKAADGAKTTDTAETPKLHVFQKKIQLGQTVGPNVVIKSGINVGDRIVVDGVQAIHEGSRINASPAKQPDGQDSTGRQRADSSIHK